MANPTTNYGFVLPTSSDLVTDLPADFDVALQGVDTRLKALQPGTTSGDLAYSSATANTNVRLGIGTSGQVLTVAAGVPAWVTAGGGGKVLQVVQATTGASVSTSSSSQTTTGLTANITPSSATSKVLVMVSQNGCVKSTGSTNTAMSLRLARSGSSIHTWLSDFLLTNTNIISHQSASLVYLDTPATTSATTYNTTFSSSNNTASVEVQNNGSGSVIILMEIGA